MARGPQRMADVLAELMARRGYGRVQCTEAYEEAWRQAAGPLAAQYSRVGALRRGTLEVIVSNSTLIQEFGFQQESLLEALNAALPDQEIKRLRFRLGSIG